MSSIKSCIMLDVNVDQFNEEEIKMSRIKIVLAVSLLTTVLLLTVVIENAAAWPCTGANQQMMCQVPWICWFTGFPPIPFCNSGTERWTHVSGIGDCGYSAWECIGSPDEWGQVWCACQ